MEIINIEARTFEAMLDRFEAFVQRVEHLCEEHGVKDLKKWLDSQEVCIILNISKRKLQTLRENGSLAYTKVERKFYYKPSDIENVIKTVVKEVKNG